MHFIPLLLFSLKKKLKLHLKIVYTFNISFKKFLPTQLLGHRGLLDFTIISHLHCCLGSTHIWHLRIWTLKTNKCCILKVPGQGCVLQCLLSLPDPEQVPPNCSILVLVRDRLLVPPPQVFEQDNQVDQGPQTQSTRKKNNNSKLNNHNLKRLNDSKKNVTLLQISPATWSLNKIV